MGITFTEILLKNAKDLEKARKKLLPEKHIRQAAVQALVDTGSGTLVISEELCTQLGVEIAGLRNATLAGGVKVICKRTAFIEVHWEDCSTLCSAPVMPGESQVLLGAIPLEEMNLLVNPKKQRLERARED